jgi:hypothetical protein
MGIFVQVHQWKRARSLPVAMGIPKAQQSQQGQHEGRISGQASGDRPKFRDNSAEKSAGKALYFALRAIEMFQKRKSNAGGRYRAHGFRSCVVSLELQFPRVQRGAAVSPSAGESAVHETLPQY